MVRVTNNGGVTLRNLPMQVSAEDNISLYVSKGQVVACTECVKSGSMIDSV